MEKSEILLLLKSSDVRFSRSAKNEQSAIPFLVKKSALSPVRPLRKDPLLIPFERKSSDASPVRFCKNEKSSMRLERKSRYAKFFNSFIEEPVISHSKKEGLMRKPSRTQDYPGARAGGEHPDEAMSSKRWSTAFLP